MVLSWKSLKFQFSMIKSNPFSLSNRKKIFIYFTFRILTKIAFICKKYFPFIHYHLRNNKTISSIYTSFLLQYKSLQIFNNSKFLNNFKIYNLNPKKQIHIDITSLINGTPKTGIQRVTYEIAKNFYKNKKNKTKLFTIDVFSYPFFKEIDKENFFLKNKIKFKSLYIPHPEDIIFLLDLNIISVINFSKVFSFYRKNKIKIISMIYDILPYTNPSWFNVKNYKKIFNLWISSILEYSDIVFTISETVKKKVIKKFKNKINKKLIIKSVVLGSDFQRFKIKKKITKKITKISFLMVGTIEPRKGHLDIINCFNKIYNNNNIELNICGKLGWKYEKIKRKLINDSKKFPYLNFIESPSDYELKRLYNKSQVLIAASYDEGFGLPIVEALHNGLHVIARGIPVFREVGKNHIYYFPDKKIDIYFQKWINYYQSNKIKNKKKISIKSWDHTYKEIIHTIKKYI